MYVCMYIYICTFIYIYILYVCIKHLVPGSLIITWVFLISRRPILARYASMPAKFTQDDEVGDCRFAVHLCLTPWPKDIPDLHYRFYKYLDYLVSAVCNPSIFECPDFNFAISIYLSIYLSIYIYIYTYTYICFLSC